MLSALDSWSTGHRGVREAADQLRRLASDWPADVRRNRLDDVGIRRALVAGYPDRIARRREPGSPRLLLSTGTGAVLADESGVREGEWLVALDVTRGQAGADSRVFAASAVERDWLQPTAATVEHTLGADGRVRAARVTWYDDLQLSSAPVAVDPAVAATLLADAYLARPPTTRRRNCSRSVCGSPARTSTCARSSSRPPPRRARSTRSTSTRICPGTSGAGLTGEAPERLDVPSGRSAPLDYREDGTVAASVKLQELFGLAETPRIGSRQEPVLLLLLAPNGRPVQTTRDLRSFWERTYPEVRKELRGRYPRHPWPDDPWTATPTARAKRRG